MAAHRADGEPEGTSDVADADVGFQDLLATLAAEHQRVLRNNEDLAREVTQLRQRVRTLEVLSPRGELTRATFREPTPTLEKKIVEDPRTSRMSVSLPPSPTSTSLSRRSATEGLSVLSLSRLSQVQDSPSLLQRTCKSQGMVLDDTNPTAKLWTVWSEIEPAVVYKELSLSRTTVFQVPVSAVRGGDVFKDENCRALLVAGPNSKRRIFWDMMSVFVIGFDVLTVPLLAFDGITHTGTMNGIGLFTTLFWSFDILVSFLSGYYEGGVVEMRMRKIALSYIRKWFPIDLLIISVDWALFLAQTGFSDYVGLVRITKTLRLSRILRLVRLLRVMKLPVILEDIASNFQSETLITVLGVSRSIGLIAIVNHFLACGWYAVGTLDLDFERNWVERMDVEERDLPYRYVTSLHWSLTQFTPASMEIFPTNSAERVFAIVVLFSALVVFSTFVSSITSAMTNLRRINTERSQQQSFIRRYITENQLTLELGNKITAFIRTHNFMAKRRVHEEDVQVFKVLPETLRLQLHWEVYAHKLTVHPVFYHIKEIDEECLFEICHKAMSEVSLATGIELFCPGQSASKVFFMQAGVVEYHHAQDDSIMSAVEAEGPWSKQWFCEAILWVKWEHRGRLSAVSPVEFVALDAQTFRKTCSRRAEVLQGCRVYAKSFQHRIANAARDFPFDVWNDFDECQERTHMSFAEVVHSLELQPAGKLTKLWRSWSPGMLCRKKDQHLPKVTLNRRCNTL